jgi:hypothetical protein
MSLDSSSRYCSASWWDVAAIADNICAVNGAPDDRQSSLARAAWITVAGICAIASLLLLVNGYDGYSAVLLFVGLSAAVNLLP